MGNPTRFLAVNFNDPEDEYLFFVFDKVRWHQIWEYIIPDDAPKDLKYRLIAGPAYATMIYDRIERYFKEETLRQPELQEVDERVVALNEATKSAFEIGEFELVLAYISDSLQSPALLHEPGLELILEDLEKALRNLFSRKNKKFDAVRLDYLM